MANSWLEACAILGFQLRLACPEGYDPDAKLLAACKGKARIVRDPKEAARGAHVLNTDVWASMGQEGEAEVRKQKFKGFIIDDALLKLARPEAVVLHCLPAHRDEEITESVLEGPQSAAWDEAENRLHAQKALLELLLAGK